MKKEHFILSYYNFIDLALYANLTKTQYTDLSCRIISSFLFMVNLLFTYLEHVSSRNWGFNWAIKTHFGNYLQIAYQMLCVELYDRFIKYVYMLIEKDNQVMLHVIEGLRTQFFISSP